MNLKDIKAPIWPFFIPLFGIVYLYIILIVVTIKDKNANHKIRHYVQFGRNEELNLALYLVIQIASALILMYLKFGK